MTSSTSTTTQPGTATDDTDPGPPEPTGITKTQPNDTERLCWLTRGTDPSPYPPLWGCVALVGFMWLCHHLAVAR